jgi:hypothetical protein
MSKMYASGNHWAHTAAALAFLFPLMMAAPHIASAQQIPEPAVEDKVTVGTGSPDVKIWAEINRRGIGLDEILFHVTKPRSTPTRIVTIQVKTPGGATVQLSPTELSFLEYGDNNWFKIQPFAKTGMYQYRWKTKDSGWSHPDDAQWQEINYEPNYRLQYTSFKGLWRVLLKSEFYGRITGTRHKASYYIDGDDMKKGPFSAFKLDEGDWISHEIVTFPGGTVELEMPNLYRIRIEENSQVVIKETRTTEKGPFGHTYYIKQLAGKVSVSRLRNTKPYGAYFSAMHDTRMPCEKWVLWAIDNIHHADTYGGREGSIDAATELAKNWAADLNGFEGLKIDVPWQAQAIYVGAATAWGVWTNTDVLESVPKYMQAHAEASKAGSVFKLDTGLLSANSIDGARKLFKRCGGGPNSQDFKPSEQRLILCYEWAYVLSWLYGDLYLENEPWKNVIDFEPQDIIFREKIIQLEGKFGISEIKLKPSGTAWSVGITGNCAVPKDSEVWIQNQDGTDSRAVASLAGGFTPLQFAWSKDGKRLAFTAWTKDSSGDPLRGEIWTVKVDGTGLLRLASGEEAGTDAEGKLKGVKCSLVRDYFAAIDFSPDGTQVSAQHFRTYRDDRTGVVWEDVDLVLIPVVGGALTKVDGARWVRYQGYDSNLASAGYTDHVDLHHWATTAWSPNDELLFGRAYGAFLNGVSVSPYYGVADSTDFNFQAIYWDPYNKPPKSAKAVIGSTEYAMTFSKYLHENVDEWKDYAHGAIYTYSGKLAASAQAYGPAKFVFTSYKDDEITYGPYDWLSMKSVSLGSVTATLTNKTDADNWGTYTYQVAASYSDPTGGTGKPWLIVQAPSIGQRVYRMDCVSGTTYRKSFTVPLTCRAGQETTTEVKYWVAAYYPSAVVGPYTMKITRTWPAQIQKSSSGTVYVTSSVSGSTSYTSGSSTVTVRVYGGISATRGRSTDTFLFRAKYYNSASKAASTATVVIDGTAYDMTKTGTDGSYTIYEYSKQLAAQADKHQWKCVFSDGGGTVTTTTASEPWVADAALSNAAVTQSTSDAEQYAFKVTAKQTAGQGTCWLMVKTSDGMPRYIKPMTKSSGDLSTGAVYETTISPWYNMYLSDGTNTTSLNSDLGLGAMTLKYQFLLADGFDGTGSKLGTMLERCGASSQESDLSLHIRGGCNSGRCARRGGNP